MTETFDKFTMLPRNRKEFGEAMKHQASVLESSGKGCILSADYMRNATGITDRLKGLALIYKYYAPELFKIWYDGRLESYVVEAYPVPQAPLPQFVQPSKLIINGHA